MNNEAGKNNKKQKQKQQQTINCSIKSLEYFGQTFYYLKPIFQRKWRGAAKPLGFEPCVQLLHNTFTSEPLDKAANRPVQTLPFFMSKHGKCNKLDFNIFVVFVVCEFCTRRNSKTFTKNAQYLKMFCAPPPPPPEKKKKDQLLHCILLSNGVTDVCYYLCKFI